MHSIWTRSTFQPQTNVLNDPQTFPLQNRSATDSSICVPVSRGCNLYGTVSYHKLRYVAKHG